MNICFVTSELTPYAKVGGLADVSTALPAALQRSGHKLRVVLPYYRDLKIEHDRVEPIQDLANVTIELGEATLTFHGYRCPFPETQDPTDGPELILIKCDELFGREGIYSDGADEFLRYLFLSRAAIESCQRLRWSPDVFHCNDWQSGLVPLLLRSVYSWDELFKNSRTILTVHNIGHQGVFPARILPYLNLSGSEHLLHQDDLNEGRINYLKTGLLYADAITTVSPTYAREIQTSEYGAGLENVLTNRQADLHGILNGIDDQEWNPETDPLIPANYSVDNLKPKLENKRQLQEAMGVNVDILAPTIGIVSRLASQKGFDLMFDVIPELLQRRDFRLVVLGSGQQKYAKFFNELRHLHPDKIGFFNGFSNEMAHLVEAGSDMFLMPSQYEPCGLNQMYSQAYGTVPIVRETGGLADTVQQFDPNTGQGSGFVFEHYTAAGLRWALNFALNVFEDPKQWHQVVVNGMNQDFSWKTQAQRYSQLYRQLTNHLTH